MSRTDLGDDVRQRLAPVESIELNPSDDGQAVVEAATRLKRKAEALADRDTHRPARKQTAPKRAATAEPALAESAIAGIPAGKPPLWTVWGMVATTFAAGLLALTIGAVLQAPIPAKAQRFAITWLPGPVLPDAKVTSWINNFPLRERLSEPNDWVMDQLAAWLRGVPGVAEVRRVSLVHEAIDPQAKRLIRTIRLELGLYTPYLPGVRADGSRVWIDHTGRILPGFLPAPASRRPTVRQIEAGREAGVREAVRTWELLEAGLEGLVTDIAAAEPLDEIGTRGIVLLTAPGARLVWGRPGEERFGIEPERKAANLLYAVRSQGDLTRVATINVRFAEPFYTLRTAPVPPPSGPR